MSSPFKLRIHKWAERAEVNTTVLELIHTIAASADRTYQLIGWLRGGVVDAQLPGRPPAPEWLTLYEDHRRVTMAVADCFPKFMGKGQQAQETLDEFRAISTSARNHPEKIKARLRRIGRPKLLRMLQQCYREKVRGYKKHLIDMQTEFFGKEPDGDAESKQIDHALKNSIEFHYYARVVLPCMLIHKTFPVALLRKARRSRAGQERAIEKLVRLDDMAASDPAVAQWRDSPGGEVRVERMRCLNKWASSGLDDGRFSARQVKESLGGMIWAVAETSGDYWTWHHKDMQKAKLTAEQIRELFHAVAQDESGRKPGVYDKDIADIQLESWRRAISDQKKLWMLVLGPGGRFKSARV